MFCETPHSEPKMIDGVKWCHIKDLTFYLNSNDVDHMVCFRTVEYMKLMNHFCKTVRNHYVWLQDAGISGNWLTPSQLCFRKFIFLSDVHKEGFVQQFSLPESICEVIHNGLDVEWIESQNKILPWPSKVINRFIYSSDANRGLYHLLQMFPTIRKLLPNATLHIYCDLDKTDVDVFQPGPHKEQCLKELAEIRQLVKKNYITAHGRVKKRQLYEGFAEAEFWFYPNSFFETFCITALEAQYFQCKVLCPKLGALPEVVKSGVIYTEQNYNEILPIDRFYLGGANTIRGYDRDYCPPLGLLTKPVPAPNTGLPAAAHDLWRYVNQGGRTMANVNFEIRFPIYDQLEGATFIDAGVLIKDSVQDVPDNLLGGAGFGFRYNTPIGPLRFDLAFKLDRKYPEFESPYAWYLTLGQAF